MFEQLIAGIDDEIVHRIYKIQVQHAPHAHPPLQNNAGNVSKVPNVSNGEPKTPFDTSKKKLGRNDPCWCGAVDPKTGKPYKYKKCGLINAPYHKG